MFHTFQRFSLEKQLFASFVGFAAVLLLLTMGVSLILDINRQMQSTDSLIRSSASYIASLDSVKNMLKQGYPDPEVTKELDSFNESLEDLHVIVICDANSLRFYDTNRQDVGDSFVNGDQEAILQGSEPYITTGYGTYGTQRRAFHAVEDADGTILGFVMTSTFTAEISAHIHRLVLYCLVLFGAALAVALGLSRGLVALLRRSLLGYHPTELLELYLQQGEVLNAVEDGLVATDPKGKVVFANQTACRLLQKSEKALKGRKLNQVFPESSCVQAARTGEAVHNRSCVISGHPVLSSEIPIPGKSGSSGVLNVFHDKTELQKLSDELSGAHYMLDTLRFFNHEFMNKLHVILGYLQTGETEKAASFIINSSLVSSQAIRETADCIRVSRICALVIGKMMHAAELGIRLAVAPDSYCRQEDLLLPEEDYVTIVGNLLENAVEELSRGEHDLKEIRLALYCRPDCNVIVCEDTGGGVDPEIQPHIFEKGVSSKGEGRGLGLCLIHQLVEQHHGTIDVMTEAGAGTCFTLTFTDSVPEEA